MSVLHGPLPVKTLGDLRQMVTDLVDLADDTPLFVSITDDEYGDMKKTGDVREASALIVDAVQDGDDTQPIIFSPWSPA